MISNDAVKETRLSKLSSTSATGTRRIRMSFSKTVVLFLLLSGFWSQMVSSAPTPQQKDAVAAAGQDNEGSLLGAESSMNTGIDYDDATTELRYGGMRDKGEPAEPPDIRARNPQSSPEIHIIDNVELVSSLFQDRAQHDTSNSTTSTNTSPSPPSKRIDLQRSVEQEEQPDWVFNIVIQKEKAQKSAFIAPDVNWLRDLVPKVVDVVDKPETLIKETIFNAMGKDDVVQADQIKDRQIFINVVKSQVDSEAEVPQILARLRNLMQTGGPEIDAIFQRQNSEDQQSKNRAVVINVVIVNVLNVNVVNVILAESKAGTDLEARTPESDVEEDSYIVALRESQKDRNKFSVPAAVDHHHHHEEKHHVVPVVGGSTTQQQFNGHYLTEVPTYGHNSTDRPLMAMEKDYLRSSNIQPAQQQLVDKQPTIEKEKDSKPKLPIDPNASLEFVNLPTGPYFTNYADKPSKTAAAVAENSGNNNNKVVATNLLPNKKPNKVKDTEKVNSMTSKATNVVRNQIRTIGFIGIPILAGLASTANAWLPAVAALGRRRKKRSAMEYEEEYDWQPNPKVVGIDDRRRAIEDAQILALLMGKRYMNVSKETLQDSIDNWKNRDQEASAAVPLHTTDVNKLASTNKPLWFQFQRPGSPQTTETTTSTTTTAPSTVKKPNYYEDENYETNKYYSNNKPLFYSAASVTDDAMEHRELVDYDDVGNVGPSLSSTSSTFTESGEYVMGDVKETQSEENVASSYPESVTPHIHILPATSPSGNDFDIVANFVQAMMMNSNNKNNGNPNYDGPENREDVDGPEHREEIYLVKSPSIVNSTIPGGANRIPSTGSTVSLFAADPIMPSWAANSENVTNSPVTYVSLRVPPVPSSPAKFPVKATTSTQPSSSDYYDDTDLIDGSDQPSSENVGLQFHEDETGITFFVSKDVPSRITTPLSSNAGTQEIKPTSTGRPSSQWFSDPFENGLFVGSSTANTFRPVSPTSIVSTSNTPIPTEPETRPISLPATRPTSFKPNFQSGTRPPPSNFQSVTRPGSTPSNIQPQFGNRPTSSAFDLQSNFQAGSRPPTSVTPSFQTNRPSGSESTPTKFQSNRPSSLLTMASFTASNRPRPTVPPPIDVSSDVGSTYTKGQSTVTNAPLQDFSTLTGDSSLVSANVDKNNVLSSIIKGAGSSPLPFKDQSTSRPTTSTGSSSDINNLFGMYSSTAMASTNRPIMTTSSSEEEIEPTLDNLMAQLETNRTGLVSTKRPVGGLHFINTSTDVVIISPYDVTPHPLYSSGQMESVEAEEEEDFTEPSDTITVDAAEGNQPDSVPAVSNLANLLFASSVSSSSGSSVSFSDSSSSGGVTNSASAVSVDPFALLYTFGLASAGILAMTLPIWVPLVVAKRRRRTGGYGLSKKKDKKKKKIKNQYPTNKKKKKKTYSQNKASYGEPPPNHYKDLDEDVNYNDEDYNPAGPGNHHQYQSTTIDDLYRGNGGSHGDYSDSDIIDNYSPLFRDLFSANSDDVLSDAGPLSSEDVYGPTSPLYYDDRRAARRRRSNSNKKQFKRFH